MKFTRVSRHLTESVAAQSGSFTVSSRFGFPGEVGRTVSMATYDDEAELAGKEGQEEKEEEEEEEEEE